MFTEQDYREYFKVLQNTEQKMIDTIDSITQNISDPKILNELSIMRNAELNHMKLEDEMLAMLKLF